MDKRSQILRAFYQFETVNASYGGGKMGNKRLDVCATAHELLDLDLGGRTVLVIDVLRATSTMVTGLANGAAGFWPVRTVAEAHAAFAVADQESIPVLLCGERGGLPIPGFDCGNSPFEYTPAAVAGRRLIFTTTNGTRALRNAMVQGAADILPVCFLNASATANYALRAGRPVTIACAGTDDQFSLDDALCAGLLVSKLANKFSDLSDLAIAVRHLYGAMHGDLVAWLQSCRHGQRLLRIGAGADIAYCSQLDLFDVVARYGPNGVTLIPPAR